MASMEERARLLRKLEKLLRTGAIDEGEYAVRRAGVLEEVRAELLAGGEREEGEPGPPGEGEAGG